MSELPEFRERGVAAVRLLQGVVYEDDEQTWAILLGNESDLGDYFCEIGLTLIIDRPEGIAYLRQFDDDERTGGYERLPRLFRKTPLGYEATLLCVLLRDEYRRFEEEDLDNERCIVDVESLLDVWKSFFQGNNFSPTVVFKINIYEISSSASSLYVYHLCHIFLRFIIKFITNVFYNMFYSNRLHTFRISFDISRNFAWYSCVSPTMHTR